MKVDTTRFGTVEVDATDIVTFPEGLPGFVDRRYVLFPHPDAPRVQILQSLEDPDLALMTVAPPDLELEYSPRYKPAETSPLRAADGDEPPLECRVVASADEAGGVRLNLFAPLMFNRAAGLAMQLPLVGSGYTTYDPWPAEE